jgi:hypothetical protein
MSGSIQPSAGCTISDATPESTKLVAFCARNVARSVRDWES